MLIVLSRIFHSSYIRSISFEILSTVVIAHFYSSLEVRYMVFIHLSSKCTNVVSRRQKITFLTRSYCSERFVDIQKSQKPN